MHGFGPRALTPRDGRDWLIHAGQLMRRRPGLFMAVALLAPAGSALLLVLPVWEGGLLPLGGWTTLMATVFCYGLPLSLTVVLACAIARAVSRPQTSALRQLFNRTALKALARATAFLFSLLLQGYLLIYWVQDRWLPLDPAAAGDRGSAVFSAAFGVADTLLGTQLSVLGGVLLVLQALLAVFIPPLQLFRELSLSACWRRSVLGMQLNPWLFPVMGLAGLALLMVPFLNLFSILSQVLALPLPVYLGVLLYVAWNDVFQGGEEEDLAELEAQWRLEINSESLSRQSGTGPEAR